jgi:UTP--glucose-1-phosphate uridylyltransferase
VILEEVDAGARAVLERYGFDELRFEDLRARVASGELSPASNVVAGRVEPLADEDVTPLPEPGGAGYEEAREAGIEAIRSGRVAVVVLAGGMATRFGGVVKALVEAVDGRCFLEIVLAESERLGRALQVEVPVALMTSFATDESLRAFVAGRPGTRPIVFAQFAAPRLAPGGSLFRGRAGEVSLYGPGHGDLLEVIRASGALDALRSRGVRTLAVSNVDNLGARLDPVVVGAHLLSGRPVTAEVARKEGDLGGAPARVDGRLGLLEGPQFPADFDQDRIEVFNTNTTTLAIDAIDRDFDLRWLYVRKSVEGRNAVQLERLYHQVSWELGTTYLVVRRTGPRGRFFPIKEPVDLEAARPALREMLSSSVLEP